MSHKQQINALKIFKQAMMFDKNFSILEIGSYDVNGTMREVFHGNEYVGVDLISGPGVDLVGSGHTIDLKSKKFNLVISSECFEHNPYWKETVENMILHLAHGGYLIVTCAGEGRLEHGTDRTNIEHSPGSGALGWNYYKNIKIEEIKNLFSMNKMVKKFYITENNITFDIYIIAIINNEDLYLDLDLIKKSNIGYYFPLSLKDIFFQLWLLPMRIIRLIVDEKNYLTAGVYYEKYTKNLIKKLFF